MQTRQNKNEKTKINLHPENNRAKKKKKDNEKKRTYPPQPLPHLQAVPQPQFPPQQDIVFLFWESLTELKVIIIPITEFHSLLLLGFERIIRQTMTLIYNEAEEAERLIWTVHVS